ncbi:hypothetical protein DID88_004577 [Monilinia fructigena]|nr:hypothetical protein DID88_004577 [Monilinia fructigena]
MTQGGHNGPSFYNSVSDSNNGSDNHLPPLDEVVRDSEDSATDEDVADTTQAKGKNLGKGKGVARGPLRPAPVLKKKKKKAQSESGTAKRLAQNP